MNHIRTRKSDLAKRRANKEILGIVVCLGSPKRGTSASRRHICMQKRSNLTQLARCFPHRMVICIHESQICIFQCDVNPTGPNQGF